MHKFLHLWHAFLFVVLSVVAAQAQEDDKGFLTRTLQDALSGAGRAVSIDGFAGALSSAASFDRMTIADADGIWLTLNDVELIWNRSALLRGRLEVESLTAGRLDLPRLPVAEEDALPEAEAAPFSLPDLPVSVQITEFSIGQINLGAPLLGEEAQLAITASALLNGDEGDVDLQAERTDGKRGVFALKANFARGESLLNVLLRLNEGDEGLAARLLNIPGRPSVDMVVQGSGPIDDFTADVMVATEGADRLAGQVTFGTQAPRRAGGTPDRRIVADIGGDVTALLAPRYRAFFGDDVALKVDALIEGTGAVEVSSFALSAQAAELQGQVALNADGWPTLIDIDGRIANPDGTAILLPLGGAPTGVGNVGLVIDYSAARDDVVTAQFDILDLDTSAALVAETTLTVNGTLTGNVGTVGQFLGDITFVANGLAPTDPALAEALGPRITGKTRLSYVEGQPIDISDLDLQGTDFSLRGAATIGGVESGFATTLDGALDASDLSRFSALAGREMDGQSDVTLKGEVGPLSGQFDLTLEGSTTDLRVGIPQADAVLAGRTALSVAAKRDETGTFLRDLILQNAALQLTGGAALRTEDSQVQADFTLSDVATVLPQYEGPVDVTATATQDAEGWRIDAKTNGPFEAELTARGLATGPDAALRFTANIPDAQQFAPQLEGQVLAQGVLAQTPDGWTIETRTVGPFDAQLAVTGRVTPQINIRFDVALPEVSRIAPQISGPFEATGTLEQTQAGFVLESRASGPFGAEAAVAGMVAPMVDITFDMSMPDLAEVVPQAAGPLQAQGSLQQTETGFVLDTRANGPFGVEAAVTGVVSPSVDVTFNMSMPDVGEVAPQVSGPLTAQGSVRQTQAGFVVDTRAKGPLDAEATVAGLVSPMVDVTFDVSVPDVGQVAPQVSGPFRATGTLAQTQDGFVVDTNANGPFGVQAAVSGRVAPMVDVTFNMSMPDVGQVAPQVRGPLQAAGSVQQTEAGFEVDTRAEGPFGAKAAVQGLATGPNMRMTFDVSVPNVTPLVPGISGPLAATGVVAQQPDGIAVDADVSGPFSSTASVDGVVTGPRAAVQFALDMPNIGALVENINGPLRLDGTARKNGDAWQIATDAEGPSGTQARLSGQVATSGVLNVQINGTAPLGLSRPFLAPRDLQGQASFDLAVNGPAALSSVSGTIQTRGATLSAPNLRLTLEGIAADVRLANNRAQIEVTGQGGNGGALRVGGGVTLTPALPANIEIGLENLVVLDPRLYRTSVGGALRLAGPLSGGAVISGTVNIGETTVNVPSTGLTSIGDIPAINHIGATRPVIATRRKAGVEVESDGQETGDGDGAVFGLDLAVSAPNRIFVRGRGLDAEVGGGLRLTGSTARVVSAGRFDLLRGRLDILGQRFELREGSVRFQGDLLPYLRFVTATATATGEVRVVVDGPADAPTVTFESTPEAPQDEVLAQLLFGRNLTEISAFQALQLANAVATLAGRGGTGVISNLREGFGLDDLDVTTTDSGATAVRAGKYISDNVYTDVTAASDGTGEVSLNLDITSSLKGRATLGSDGTSGIGIFFEKDY